MEKLVAFVTVLLLSARVIKTLDNGLALTPPMGWLTWERFRCNVDCKNQPDSCISENLIKTMANIMVNDGYLKAGYDYIIIDDCWLSKNRTADGRLQPDPERFPSGIKKLADYVHTIGLKFGIYEDFGTKTCGGYPGSEFHLEMDAKTFADWGVDYVKFDGCFSDPKAMDPGYEAFGFFLNITGRPMVYSCEWPLYQAYSGLHPNYTAIQSTCNLWRNHGDIQDTWDSVSGIIKYYGDNDDNFAKFARPGAWNDPDMLVVGNFGLSPEQSKVQMAMWAIMASPLIMSTDLRSISVQDKLLLTNQHLISINQDPLGIQGQRILSINRTLVEVWAKPISPPGSFAIAFLQLHNSGTPKLVNVFAKDVGLTNQNGYDVTDGFSGDTVMKIHPGDKMKVLVNPNGVVLFKAILS